jgi:hypothetical protein
MSKMKYVTVNIRSGDLVGLGPRRELRLRNRLSVVESMYTSSITMACSYTGSDRKLFLLSLELLPVS